jgi:hypothetical protein
LGKDRLANIGIEPTSVPLRGPLAAHASVMFYKEDRMKQIKWGKAVLAGLVANVASFIVGGGGYMLIGRAFFKLEPSSFWRWTPSDPFNMPFGWYIYLIVGNTLLAIVIAVIYAVLYDSLPYSCINNMTKWV